jgi:hypothetical protein
MATRVTTTNVRSLSSRTHGFGDLVRVTLPTGVLTYQIEQTGLSPKTASALPAWASDSTVRNRVVLVTCAFEQGDTSTNNIVVVANLR